jgi:hypothetical protein
LFDAVWRHVATVLLRRDMQRGLRMRGGRVLVRRIGTALLRAECVQHRTDVRERNVRSMWRDWPAVLFGHQLWCRIDVHGGHVFGPVRERVCVRRVYAADRVRLVRFDDPVPARKRERLVRRRVHRGGMGLELDQLPLTRPRRSHPSRSTQ